MRKMKEAKTQKETVTSQVKKTRGKIKVIDRAEWYYMKKRYTFTDIQLASLNEATCPAKVNDMPATLVRIFNPDIAKEKGVTIEDYESLNEHPEWILYEGYHVGGRRGEIIIQKREGVGTSLLEEKIKQGAITQVGVTVEKTGSHKWLDRIVSFMAMGGFILVLFVIWESLSLFPFSLRVVSYPENETLNLTN
jgi:hypothetical protein